MDRTVNEFAIAHEDTFKKLARRNDITFPYLIESRWCGRGSNESRLLANEIVMKSASRLGICGDGTTTSTRSIVARNSVSFISNLRGVKVFRNIPNVPFFRFNVIRFTNEITGRKLKSLPGGKKKSSDRFRNVYGSKPIR